MTNCPNCNRSLSGIFSSKLMEQNQTDRINHFLGTNKAAYCKGCGEYLLNQANRKIENHNPEAELRKKVTELIKYIPVISSQAPLNWEYEVIDMVTSQRTSGTGFLTELSQVFNDAFGLGSGTTDRKIAQATEWCKIDLRSQCAVLGGNAVIATDIDFSEVGTGATNMLMVCMAGTAIKVHDVTKVSSRHGDKILEGLELIKKVNTFS